MQLQYCKGTYKYIIYILQLWEIGDVENPLVLDLSI
jgi:hypothetical protein